MFKRILSVLICLLMLIGGLSNVVFATALDEIQFSDISIELQNSVTRNLTLIKKYQGVDTYTWLSDKPTVITNDGIVNRPLVGMNDEIVRLTVSADGSSKFFDVTVKAFANNQELLDKAKETLNFTDLSAQPINAVTENLTLPGSWKYGSTIYWTSSNESVISINDGVGVVNRPSNGEGISNVLLTATIIYDDTFVTKYFLVKVKELDAAYQISTVLNDTCNSFENAFLSVQNIIDLRSDLVIPESTHGDVVITCKSSDTNVITDEGIITRSESSDVVVLFAVSFKMGYEITKRSFPVVVKAYEQESILSEVEADVDYVIAQLNQNHNLSRLTESISLPSTGQKGSTFTYVSSNTQAFSNGGTVTRGESAQTVILTITGYKNGEAVTKNVSITVPGRALEGPSGGLSGGGSSSDGKVKMYVEQEAVNEDTTFKDVSKTHWAYEAVKYLYNAGIVNGMGKSLFAPDALVTREQMVKMLMDSIPNIHISNYEIKFDDVELSSWYAKYVGTANFYSLVNGIGDRQFGVGKNITRQDMAVMIFNTLSMMEKTFTVKNNSEAFTDMHNVSDYAKNAVSEIKKYALVSGRGNNMYCPTETLTRAEAATIIYRILTY